MTLCHDCRQPFKPSLPKQLYCQGCRSAFKVWTPQYYARTAANGRRKLTAEQVLEIRNTKLAPNYLGYKFALAASTITAARTGRTYADVK